MDSLNMTNRAQIHEFFTKFQLNISKIMPARPKKHRDMGCEHYNNTDENRRVTVYLFINLPTPR